MSDLKQENADTGKDLIGPPVTFEGGDGPELDFKRVLSEDDGRVVGKCFVPGTSGSQRGYSQEALTYLLAIG